MLLYMTTCCPTQVSVMVYCHPILLHPYRYRVFCIEFCSMSGVDGCWVCPDLSVTVITLCQQPDNSAVVGFFFPNNIVDGLF